MVDVADARHPWSDDIIVPPQKKAPTPYIVAVRSFSIHNGVSVRDIFLYDDSFYFVFEHMPMSLTLFTGFPKHLDEDQLVDHQGHCRKDVDLSRPRHLHHQHRAVAYIKEALLDLAMGALLPTLLPTLLPVLLPVLGILAASWST